MAVSLRSIASGSLATPCISTSAVVARGSRHDGQHNFTRIHRPAFRRDRHAASLLAMTTGVFPAPIPQTVFNHQTCTTARASPAGEYNASLPRTPDHPGHGPRPGCYGSLRTHFILSGALPSSAPLTSSAFRCSASPRPRPRPAARPPSCCGRAPRLSPPRPPSPAP